ncbi:MAG: non-homologous end-joining DNA ligase [Candidatus Babeliales bacterium]
MNKNLEKLSNDLQKKIKIEKMPTFKQPMLATLTKDYFSNKDWIFERKFDGIRCLIFKNKNKVILKSRNNKLLDKSFPEILEAAKKLAVDQIILDGEVVAFKGKVTSFEKLQSRSGVGSKEKALATGTTIYIYVFDVLYLDNYSLVNLPLENRKSILKYCIKFKDPLRYTIHKNAKGKEFFKEACKKGWEGLIAKKRDSKYVPVRSKNWLKFKCVANQELVIGGYTKPQKSRIGFGALLMGYYKNDVFHYAGKVGTRFSDSFLKEFSKKLKKTTIKKNPFSSKEMEDEDVNFVKPHYVAEIGFEEWTRDNKLRQARFLGLRYDKAAKKVVKEEAK